MMNPRWIPPIAVVLLVVVKAFDHDFLSHRVFPNFPLTWFFLVFVPLLWLAAWCASPAFVSVVSRVGLRWLVPPALFIALVVGVLWFVDELWNHTAAIWFGAPQIHALSGLTMALWGS